MTSPQSSRVWSPSSQEDTALKLDRRGQTAEVATRGRSHAHSCQPWINMTNITSTRVPCLYSDGLFGLWHPSGVATRLASSLPPKP